MKLSKTNKNKLNKPHKVSKTTIWAHGPYTTQLEVDGIKITTMAYVTDDKNFNHDLVLGKEIWAAKKINFIQETPNNDQQAEIDKSGISATREIHKISKGSKTILNINGEQHPALIDTGAGPSLMTLKDIVILAGKMKT